MADIDVAKIRRVDGSLLLILASLLRTGSATRTADELALSQSAISHALVRLRAAFGAQLFSRAQRGLEPTEFARGLEPQLHAVLEGLDGLLSQERSFNPAASDRWFRISAPEFVSVTIGAALLEAVSVLAPSCRVQIVHLEDDEARTQLRRGQLDLALGRFQHPGDASLEVLPGYEDRFCVAARVGHPLLSNRITLRGYRKLRHIFAESRSEVLPADTSGDMPDLKFMVVPRWLAALSIAAQSDMVATCPRRLAESQLATMRLNLFKLPWDVLPIRVTLLRRRDNHVPAVDWLVEQLMRVVSGAPRAGRSRNRRATVQIDPCQ